MKLVVTVVGQDRVGIIAMVSAVLAENNVNIMNINQNIIDGFFNMAMIAEMADDTIKLSELQKILKKNLAKYEIPREYRFVTNLPVTKMGKIDFKALQNLE